MIGKIISHYKILEELGRGGMGVVYKAEDTKLKRLVALKFLPPDLTRDEEAKERFIHEAQAASALDHPNICTIHEIDEAEGQLFIAMAYIEGQSLKAKIDAGPLKLDEALSIAMQVAEGLQAAHEKGIVHRDIKSANIMVMTKGQAKIMDFGLAKLAGRTKLTKTGMTVGTAAYMSPEQARGEEVDVRTDIWSFGVVMYEMLTGRLPFRAEYEAAMTYSILNEEPEPITSLRTGVPMELERLVNKAMSKKPNERYQHVDELAVDLRNIKAQVEKASLSRPTIQRTKSHRSLWLAVGAALVLLFLLLFSQWTKFTHKAEASESYLAVIPFENLADPQDTQLSARKLTELTVTVLAQSRSLRVLSSQRLYDAMKQMGKRGLQAVDRTVATEVAKRAGANLMLTGSILQVEPHLVVTLQTVTVATGEVISSHQINGSNLFALADSFRFKLSEPLKFDPEIKMRRFRPVSQISTASEEAYRSYVQGLNEMYVRAFPAARQHFRRAIAIDSTFAQAYTHLALIQWWSHDFSAAAENINQALRYLEKLPPKERLFIQGMDDLVRAWDQPQAARRFQQYVEENPFGKEGFYALGEALYHGGHYEESLPAFRRAMELDPEFSLAFVHLAEMLAKTGRVEELLGYAQKLAELYPNEARGLEYFATAYRLLGRMDEAISTYEKIIAADPNDINSLALLGDLHRHRGDYAKAELYYKRLPSAGSRENSRERLPLIPLRQGKLNEAIRMLRTGIAADSLDGTVGGSTMWKQVNLCYALWLKGNCAAVMNNAKRVTAFHPAPYFMRDFYAHYARLCGALDDIRQDLAGMEAFKTGNPGLYYETLGHLKLGERKLAEAIAVLDTAFHISAFHEFPPYEYDLALAHFENGQLGEAAAHLENILRKAPVMIDIEAPAILLLGKVYEASGWRKQALEQYKKLLDMWVNGDRDNQLLIETRERYERLRQRL